MPQFELTDERTGLTKIIEAETASDAYYQFTQGQGQATTPDIGMGGQALAGANEAIANILGLPVDVATAAVNYGLEAVGGAPIQQPMGGSESFKGLMGLPQTLRGEQRLTDIPPATRGQEWSRTIGGTAAASALPAAGMLARGYQASAPGIVAPQAGTALGRGLTEASIRAAEQPGKFAATEAATALGGGAGIQSAREISGEPSPGAETIGGILGALGGAKTAGGVQSASNIARRALAERGAPRLESGRLASQAGNIYDDIAAQQIEIPQRAAQNSAIKIRADLKKEGAMIPKMGKEGMPSQDVIRRDYPKVQDQLDALESFGISDRAMTSAELVQMRRSIANAIQAAEGPEKRLLSMMLKRFDDDFLKYAPDLKTANQMYSRAMKARTLEKMADLAEVDVTQAGGTEQAIRREFKKLARNIAKGYETNWTDDEIKLIQKIATGGPIENALSIFGKFNITSPMGAGLGGGAGFGAGTAMGLSPQESAQMGAAMVAGGTAARQGAEAIQQGNIERLIQNALRGRSLSPEGEIRLQEAIQAYMAGQAAQEPARLQIR